MNPMLLIAALAGCLTAAGVVLAVVALRPVRRVARRRSRGLILPDGGWARWRWPATLGAGLVGWVLIGWPVAGLIAGAAVLGVPILLGSSATGARPIARAQALEEWTRRLGDILTVGVGLEQAIIASARSAPPVLADEVGSLAARLSARWPTESALRGFADALDDATADLVVAALLLADRRRGPGLAHALSSLAGSVAEDVAARRAIEADRAKPRATARAVTVITLGVVVLGLANGAYMAPYATPTGQIVLAVIAGMFVATLAWMRSMTLSTPHPRLLASTPSPDAGGER